MITPTGRASASRSGHRVFLDANVLFSAAYREDSGLQRLWGFGRGVALLSASYAVAEAQRNLAETKALDRLSRLVRRLEVVPDITAGPLPPGIALPEKDRPILLTALTARATHLLTGDRAHFGRYFGHRISGMMIERPGDYLRREGPP